MVIDNKHPPKKTGSTGKLSITLLNMINKGTGQVKYFFANNLHC